MNLKDLNILIDFDSTIIQLETIEVLAEIALTDNKNKQTILKEIKDITSLAMIGEISFDIALNKRISLLNIDKTHIDRTIEHLKGKLTSSFVENINLINQNINNCFVISGGFKEIILPILKPYGFNKNNIFANTFLFNNKGIVDSVDRENPLSKDKGKIIVAKNFKGYNIVIGDGFTDYELKKYNNAILFILFTENIYRKKLSKKADFIARNFKEVFDYIKNVTKK